MTAATVTTRFKGPFAKEKVRLTITDDYTHSSALGSPLFCQITEAQDMGSQTVAVSYSISGRDIAFQATGVSAKVIAVTVYGKID